MIKTDCFAFNNKKKLDCTALDDLYCKRGECRFYKTRETFLRDARRAEKINERRKKH